MQSLSVFMVIVTMVATPIFLILWVANKLRKKPTRKWKKLAGISAACFAVFTVLGVATADTCEHEYTLVESEAATCEVDGFEKYRCELCGLEKTEKLEKLGHDMVDDHRTEPTEDADGEYVRKCSRCGYEEVEVLELEVDNTAEPEEEDSHEVSDAAQMVLAQIAEDMAKQIAKNPSTVKMSIFSQGFYKDGHTYAVQSDFTCSNAYGVEDTKTIKVVAVSNEDESKISPIEVYLDGTLIWVREDNE